MSSISPRHGAWYIASSVALIVACGASKAPVSPLTQATTQPTASAAPPASSAALPVSSAAPPGPTAASKGVLSGPTEGEFQCAAEQRPVALRVEERFAIRTIPIDIHGQEVGAMDLVDAKNVYTLTSLAHEGRRMNRVEIVLQSHAFAPNAASFSAQEPWQKALTGGWLELNKPSVIERHGDKWCFEARKCPAAASAEYQFLDALAAIVVTMMPLEKLQAQLDHKPSDGTLGLEYADTAAFMVGEKNAPILRARQLGSGIPASFEVRSERRNVSIRSAATSAVKLPRKSSKASKLETLDRVTVDRDCRLRRIDLTIAAEFSLVPNTKSAIRMLQIHERTLIPQLPEVLAASASP